MKLLLDYEEVALHLQYNAKKEFFSNSVYPPNPECKDPFCLNRQADKKKEGSIGILAARKTRLAEKVKNQPVVPQQSKEEVDKWGIELVDEPTSPGTSEATTKVISSQSSEHQSKNIDDLMSQLSQL